MAHSAVFLSFHAYESRRRAGFHWLADAYARAGYRVDFITVGLSPLSILRKDHRMEFARKRGLNRSFEIAPGTHGYYWFLPFHPVNLQNALANWLSTPLFRLYALLPLRNLDGILRNADRIIIESSLALAFAPRVRQLALHARLIYRVSDDVAVIGAHPVVREFERAAIASFDLISVPSDHMRGKFPPGTPVAVHCHGIEKTLLDAPHPDPYPRNGRKKVLAMGTMLFDAETFLGFADSCPSADFHLFGDIKGLPARSNIVLHGERPFKELVPYIQHANAGFAPYRKTQGCEYLAHTSNKLMQFTYCRVPVLLPCFIPHEAAHVIAYDPDNPTSFSPALKKALAVDRAAIDRVAIRNWDEICETIEKELSPCAASAA